jgi:hypothetical protein
MSPRIIQIPLSGGDRKARAKGIARRTVYLTATIATPLRAAEIEIRKAGKLECDAWNAIMWAGGPPMPARREERSGADDREGAQCRL